MDSQYKLLSELLSDQAAFITSPKTSLANYWGGHCPPAPQCLRACGQEMRDLIGMTTFVACVLSFYSMTVRPVDTGGQGE